MNIIIGCKLPHGITLKGSQGQPVELNGMNKSLVLGGFGLTHVDENESAFLFATYAEFGPFASKAIFTYETNSVADLVDMAADLKGEKTGFEPINPDQPVAPNTAAANKIEAADSKQLDAAKEAAERNPVPTRAPKSAADKAAAKEAKALTAGNA